MNIDRRLLALCIAMSTFLFSRSGWVLPGRAYVLQAPAC